MEEGRCENSSMSRRHKIRGKAVEAEEAEKDQTILGGA